MKPVISEFQRIAEDCRELSKLLPDISIRGLTVRLAAAEAIDELRDKLREVVLPQLDAVLARSSDETADAQRTKLERLIEHGGELEDDDTTNEAEADDGEEDDGEEDDGEEDDEEEGDEEEGDAEEGDADDREPDAQLLCWSVSFTEIGKCLMWFVAHLASLPKGSFNTSITEATIGSLSIGNQSRARGKVTTKR